MKVSLIGAIRAGMLSMPFHFGWSAFLRSIKLNSALEKIRFQLIPDPHYYLMAIGVDPSEQGKGLGRALLRPTLRNADINEKPCYLETFSERKLPKKNYNWKFGMIDVEGQTVVVKLFIQEEEKLKYIDYLTLYKFEEGWKVITKQFSMY